MSGTQAASDHALKATPLDGLHRELGAEMVPFAEYDMPLRYPAGIIAEHQHCRSHAGLFDVSHMGQVVLSGDGVVDALERLVPGDIASLKTGRLRYTVLTNSAGGIIDDLMVTRRESDLFLVLNASRVEVDLAHIKAYLPDGVRLDFQSDRALIALQGPEAVAVISRFDDRLSSKPFMSAMDLDLAGAACQVSRSGYTGEDGVEISVAAEDAESLARLLLDQPEVAPVGLGARDSLRLEAGLCLYGADIDETTSPIEAGLAWTIGKRRKIERGFLGDEAIMNQLFDGPKRRRVGIKPLGRAPARAHTVILNETGEKIGEVTSGGFGPTVEGPIAMGYVEADYADDGTRVGLEIRGRAHDGEVVPLPFVPKGWR